MLAGWEPARRILWADEARSGPGLAKTLAAAGGGPWAVLIGPEGGFSEVERTRLRALPFVVDATTPSDMDTDEDFRFVAVGE